MIEIKMGDCSLEAHGHAGAGAKGEDLVCAAVSALVYALAYNLAVLEGGKIRDVQILLEDGAAKISAENTPKVRGMFTFTRRGLELLEKNNPGNLHITKS